VTSSISNPNLGGTSDTTANNPVNTTQNNNITNKPNLNTTLPEQLAPQSINGSTVPKI
jgi:hypothetical protein